MSEPVIEVKGLSKSYIISHQKEVKKASVVKNTLNALKKPLGGGGPGYNQETFWALKDVSFSVPQGEIFGVLGKNGSGKSTLLKILSRIVEPTKGGVTLRGRTASLLEVGTGFHPELTGRENVFLNGSMLGLSRQEIISKFNEIVEFSEIEQFIDTPVKFYSSGMYVRLAFAVAAHLEPEILILDEVLAVGDASFQRKSMNKILSTMQSGRTVLFVSHSMDAVRQLCTSGILLDKGHVTAEGKIGSVIDRYMLTTMNDDPTDITLKSTWKRNTDMQNDYFIPESLSVVDSNGNDMQGTIRCDQDYWVKINGMLKTTDENFAIGYSVWDKDSKNMIYMCMSTDTPKNRWPKLQKGNISLLGKLPKHILNESRYKISALATLHYKAWIFDPEATPMRIEVKVSGGLSESPIWVEARGGMIAPNVEWRND